MLIKEQISTRSRSEVVDLTRRVREIVRGSGVKEGLCVVYVPHTTAAVSINENADPDVKHDVLRKLDEMIPQDEGFYRHNEGNSDSHLKTILTGPSVTLIIDGGELVLGTWQGLYFCEYDGPRRREYYVKIVAG
jgi:secondary thiamine-phosphate synthase enzyme